VGLSFSVAPEVRPIPGSLINIYREMGQDLGCPPPSNGDLTPWTKLNAYTWSGLNGRTKVGCLKTSG
jgi:uracil DNA glycosylase